MSKKSKKSGEIVIGLIVGVVVGGIALAITANNHAQERANSTGKPVASSLYLKENPGKSTLVILGPAVAGAGIGWALDESSGGSSSEKEVRGGRDATSISVTGDGNTVQVRGDETTFGSSGGSL